MKKVLIALTVVAAAASFASCQKTCECTYKVGGISTVAMVSLDDYEDAKSCKDLTQINVAGAASVKCK
ncbi:MAG: hypothetical protein K6E93_01775 [Bacteroidales bacterium]|jgi:hypothetical protein|nr:hypothetical protein [Bacteroidales bacterium]